MDRRLTSILLLVAVVLVTIPLLTDSSDAAGQSGSDDPTSDEVTFYGYVSNLSDQERNTPLAGVNVTLCVGDQETDAATVTTDEDGRFEFQTTYSPDGTYYLLFSYDGYTVRSLPDLSMSMDEEGYVQFQLRADMLDEEGKYRLTGTADGPHAIVMVITTGSIYGNVYGDDGAPVSGATVSIVSDKGQTYTAGTDGNGYFQFTCPYGTYSMTVSCNGFGSSTVDSVSTDHGRAYSITLEKNTSEVFLGLDSAHAMLVMGAILLVAFLLVVAFLVRRSDHPDSNITVENDLDPSSEDEIRRP